MVKPFPIKMFYDDNDTAGTVNNDDYGTPGTVNDDDYGTPGTEQILLQ